MANEIFFDLEELRRGRFFHLKGDLQTEQGKAYNLEDWIDRGGNATVFKCHERATGEERAIKFLIQPGNERLRRFCREIELLKLVASDHLIRYYGDGKVKVQHNQRAETEELRFVIMELAERNLKNLIREKNNPLDYELYAGQFRGLAKALELLHKHNAIHRDIKPENILVIGERWILSDYGLCSFVSGQDDDITEEGQNLGPKFWLSPEARNRRMGCGDEINTASDVFQLASIFWYVATGRHPYGIVTEDDWIGSQKMFTVLHRSLFHDFRKRPQNGAEFLREIESALSR